jgi:hypothetical protein
MTRYNLVLPGFRARAGVSNTAEHRHWLDERLKLFKAFCLPSVLRQTMPPDLWVLGFDGDEREAVEPVLDAVQHHPWIVPAWQERQGDTHEGVTKCFARVIAPRVTDEHSHVMLTRVDNDDSLGREYLSYASLYASAVCARTPALDDFWICFPLGAAYFERRCWVWVYPGNPFLSRVQTRARFLELQVYWVAHTNVLRPDYPLFLPSTTEPMWLHNFHGGNVKPNRFGGRLRFVPTSDVLKNFSVQLGERDTAGLETGGWRAGAKRASRRVAKRVRRALRGLQSSGVRNSS